MAGIPDDLYETLYGSSPLSDSEYAEELQVHELVEAYLSLQGEPSTEETILHETQDQDGIFPGSDSEYAEELQFQELLVSSLPVSDLQISQKGESSRIYCEICTEDKERNETFKIESCSHSFCLDCIAKHVQTKINDNIHDITCPICNESIEPESCRHIISEETFARWEKASIEATVLPSHKFYCPYNNCSFLLINDEDQETIRESVCPSCGRLFCAQCKVPWNTEHECEEFQKSKKDDILEKLIEEKKWKKCPNCNSVVDKTHGCIHMTCRCGCEFCYVCGSNWSQSHWECQDSEEA